MKSKRFTRSCSSGFTLTELLVAMAITVAIGGGALTLALSSRRMYDVDQARTRANRHLRAAGDFLVSDLHQAGERLSDDFPALEIVNGGIGAPDELFLRRNILSTVLRVCSDVSGTNRDIEVAWKPTHPLAPAPAGCAPLADDDANGWPDNVDAWRNYRQSNGGLVLAYIYNPVTKLGEFFWYRRDVDAPDAYVVRKKVGTGVWLNSYSLADQSRLYILEERRYRLTGDLLQLIVNGDVTNPTNLVDRMQAFQVRAIYPAATLDSLRAGDVGYNWVGMDSIEVQLEASVPYRDRQVARAWTSRIMPRNILSR